MHKSLIRHVFYKIALGAAIICFFVISATVAGFAESPPTPPEFPVSGTPPEFPVPGTLPEFPGPNTLPELPGLTKPMTVKIQAKATDAIFVNERRFTITKETVIRELFGETIALRDLIVPCEAEIKCRLIPNQDDAVCLEIKVKRHLKKPG